MKISLFLTTALAFAGASFSQSQTRPDFFGETLQLQAGRSTTLISLKDSSYWHSSWGKATSTWDYILRNVYHYNSFYKEDGNISSHYTSGSWTNEENAKNYVYDSNHRLQEVTFEGWNGSWSDYYKHLYTYDAAGNLLTQTDQIWLYGAWRNSYYSSFTYSGNNRMSALYQYWNSTTNSWDNNMRSTFTYTGNQLSSATEEDWNATSWANSMRRTNFVYAGTDLLSYDFEMWNGSLGIYELKTRTSFTYDTNHHMLGSNLEAWNSSIATWEKSRRTAYSYDAHWNQTQILEESWDTSTNNWENSSLIVNYYTVGSVGIQERSAQEGLLLYPCPVVSQLTVSAGTDQEAELWSTEGKLVMTMPVKKGINTIDLHEISKGLYFIRLDGKTGKVIKE